MELAIVQYAWGKLAVFVFGTVLAIAGLRWFVVSRRASHGTVGNWLPLGLLCVVGAVGLILIGTLMAPRPSYHESASGRPRTSAMEAPIETVGVATDSSRPGSVVEDDSEVWRDIVHEQFEADIYPSSQIAATALARQIEPHIQFNVLPKFTSPSSIQIVTRTGLPDEHESAVRLAARLQTEFESPTAVTVGESSVSREPGRVLITLTMEPNTYRSKGDGQIEQARSLKATIDGELKTVAVMTRFIEKPWVAHFDEFVSARPDSTFLLARTPQFVTSPQAVLVAADERAVDAVVQLVMTPDRNRSTGEIRAGASILVRNQVRWMINSGLLVKDRFVQKLKRPYGEVWRGAALLEITPTQLQSLRTDVLLINQRTRSQAVSFVGGLLGIFVTVICLYVFLNQATKGYYQAKLVAWLSGAVVVAGLAFSLVRQDMTDADLVRPATEVSVDSSLGRPPTQPTAVPPVLKPRPARSQPASPPDTEPLPAKPVVKAPLNDAETNDEGRIDPASETP